MLSFPTDVSDAYWDSANLSKWKDPKIISQYGRLHPLEAKALHVIGTLVQIFNATGYLLYCDPNRQRPYADYALYAYLMACTAIELLGRCVTGNANVASSTLADGLTGVGLDNVYVNVQEHGKWTAYCYDKDKLTALRNLAAHGQAVASVNRTPQDVFLHVELLDSFPGKLATRFDSYYEDLFSSPNPLMRRYLAKAAIEPVLYSEESGQIYKSAIKLAYEEIYQVGKKPSDLLKFTAWQIYK